MVPSIPGNGTNLASHRPGGTPRIPEEICAQAGAQHIDLPGRDKILCFIKVTPNPRINVYGLGIPLLQMAKDEVAGNYWVKIPLNRR